MTHAECQAQVPAALALLAAAHAKPVDPAEMCAWCTATVVIVPHATAQGFLSLVASVDIQQSLTGKLLRLMLMRSKAPAIDSLVTLHTVKGLS